MRTIKLMPDYDCFPLWEVPPHAVGNIDPKTLSISTVLQSRLISWADRYDATLNGSDPPSSGFATREDQDAFERDGRALAELLRAELGENYSVIVQI